MINIDTYLSLVENNLPEFFRRLGCKDSVEMMMMPVSAADNPFGTQLKFRQIGTTKSLVIDFEASDFQYDPQKVIDDILILLEDKFAPRKSRIGAAAMPKNQVPTGLRTRIPCWKSGHQPSQSLLIEQLTVVHRIHGALNKCHTAFRNREHGGVAEGALRRDLEEILQLPYEQ